MIGAPPVPAYILAGGASRRMGQDKALTPWRGRPLALHVAQALEDAGARDIHIVGNQPGLGALGLPVLQEAPHPGHHPLYGVAAALDHASGALALVVACDLIGLTPTALELFVTGSRPLVAVDAHERRALLATLPTDLAVAALSTAQAGGSVQRFFADIPPLRMPLHLLRNANSPEDLGD